MPVFLAGVALSLCSILCLSLLARALSRWFSRGTGSLRGPPSPSWLFGATKILAKSSEAGPLYEQWAEEYGSAFNVPCEFGRSCLVLCDPKAIQHFYIRETRAYVHTSLTRTFTERLVGRCLFWAEGETHRSPARQRKALAPAFSPTAVKELLPVFSATAHKVVAAWDALLAPNDSTEVDIRDCYDAFGSASLGRDFGTLCGKHSYVVEAVDSIRNLQAGFAVALQLSLSLVFPVALRIPTTFQSLHKKLDAGLNGIVGELLAVKIDKSDSQSSMSLEEVHSQYDLTQLKLLLLTGYVTTSSEHSMTPRVLICSSISELYKTA
ncbi:hypothetical protein FOMPIDRAFT_1019585 [Fomitopsis schrenkii]|uniref:Cytochrome P450 n=1 Tax=Fomitopsis schrenkii TaxID=2126942 RepID=S8DVL8_FOMSC|nr:hypothetical protein FOMPIDRAFT_1019585 [Fomitopsis schrenkii]